MKWNKKVPFKWRSKYVSLYLANLDKRVNYECNFIRLLGWPRRHKHYMKASHFYVIPTLCVCLYLKVNRDLYLHLLLFTD